MTRAPREAALRNLSVAVVFVLIAASLIASPVVAPAGAHTHKAHLHQSGGNPMAALVPNPDGFPERKNGNGQWHSGGRAVAHHAGGVPITDPSVTSKAPDGRFFRLGINGWEPSMGVDDKGRIFYQARHSNLQPQVVRSTNDGHTWEIVSPMLPGGVPAHPLSLDPILHLDKDTGRVFTNNIPPDITCQPLSFSDDAGESWTNTGICGHFDHQTIFSGPPPKGGDQPIGYENVVYYCAINLVMLSGTSTATTCGRSLDGGLTWLPSGEPAYLSPLGAEQDGLPWCDGAVGHGFVGDDGTVYLPRGWCGQPFLSFSKDEGLTWDQVQVAKNGSPDHEAGVVADSKGNLYYTWIANDDLPYLAISRDGGKKWSDPMMIGTPGIRRSSLPSIDIGDDGKIAMTYIASETPGPEKKSTWNGYVTMTADALAPNPVFYTGTINAPSDPLHRGEGCGGTRCHSLGDFFDVTIGPDGTPWVAFVDACYESPTKCVPTFDAVGIRGEGVVGRMVGGPKLK